MSVAVGPTLISETQLLPSFQKEPSLCDTCIAGACVHVHVYTRAQGSYLRAQAWI